MPLVSVIIPAYNAMKYLPKALGTVLNQTFTDFEVLIINDGSSDNIITWISSITDPRVRLINQPNKGVSEARNTGIVQAQGEYLAFLDADDMWRPTKLEKQVEYLNNYPSVGLVYNWTEFTDEKGEATGVKVLSQMEGNVWEEMLVNDKISNGSSVMIRRICFEKAGLFDPNLTILEDRDMWLRIAAYYPFGLIKECLTLYRRHFSNATKNRDNTLKCMRYFFEKTFKSLPIEKLYLRNRCYGWVFLYLAWCCLEEKNYQEAINFRQQALLHYPQLIFKRYCILLTIAIFIMNIFGYNGYERLKFMTRIIRGFLKIKGNNSSALET
jgi:glycosyltransferase involved in cell wall biosynthesis